MRLRRFAFFLCLLFSCGFMATGQAAVSITTTAFNPSTATVGVGYSANSAVTATGGQTPYSWSATGFPNGMSINSSSGAPFGTPTVAGTFNVNVTVRDSSNPQQTASKTLTLTVNSASTPALSITSTAFNPSTATVGVGYSANSAVSATGGQTPYSWSATGFPNGMSINSSSGAPFGTPTVAGTFNVNVTVRDSSSPQKTASKTLTLTVNNASTPALSITSNAFNPSTATVGVGYSAQSAVTATGGQTPYSWSATGFPNGMSINSSTGAPFGTPTVAGTFNVNVTVRDSSSPQKTASKTLTLTVNDSGTPALSITTTAFNPSTATVGVGYSAQSAVTATGGQTPYSWSATGFPNGMSINSSTGAPFGTPTVAGTFNVNVTVRDSSSPQKTASKTLTLTVSDSGTPALSITTTAFNPSTAMVGVGYAAQSAVTATGGQTPYSWSATGFPNGMSINSSTGAPFGTPTVAGTFNVNVTVQDSSSPQKTASKTLTLTVSNSDTTALSITTTAFNPSTATVGTGYAAQSAVTATGGQTPYSWSATGFPDGMSINSSTGAPFGTPTVAGTFNVNVTVRDNSSPQKTASKTLTLTVSNAGSPVLSITTTGFNPSTGTVGIGYAANSAVAATGGQTPYTWSAAGFPSGMSINSSTGAPFGTPTVAGTFNVTVTVRDSSNPQQIASKTLPLTIGNVGTQPLQPDLEPTDVTVSRDIVSPGDAITVSARVWNRGGGDALASKSRLRINSSATGTTATDLLLVDIDTPAIISGESAAVTRGVTIPGLQSGIFYIWVVADNTNANNQSDRTNDYARSPAVTVGVNNPGVVPSNLHITPSDVTFDAGKTATLTVVGDGIDASSNYQWFRNNRPLPFSPTATINVSADGDYYANVSNRNGQGRSTTTRVVVNPRTLTGGLASEDGALRQYRWVGKQARTVVITHGWQQGFDDDKWDTNPPGGAEAIATAINSRNDLLGVNILLYLWRGAYTLPLNAGPAFVATKGAGHILAADLVNLLGSDYAQPVHFVGHSFGTFVNAHAVGRLPWKVGQFTILDAPINFEAKLGTAPIGLVTLAGVPSARIFYDNLRAPNSALVHGRVSWVDNYVAAVPTFGTLVFGNFIPGTAPYNGGELLLDQSHVTIQEEFYAPSVLGEKHGGFGYSVLKTIDGTSSLAMWDPSKRKGTTLSTTITSLGLAIGGTVVNAYDVVNGATQSVLKFFNSFGSRAALLDDGRRLKVVSATGTGTEHLSSADSSAQFDVTVPPNAASLTFDFLYAQPGDGDWMTVSFNDQVLYSFTGRNWFGGEYDKADIPVSHIAGQTGVITLTLHSASSLPAELRVGDIRFTQTEAAEALRTRVANISTRANVGTGDEALIGGFIVTGTEAKKVLIRAIGPSLPLGNRLSDPALELHDSAGAVIAFNDNWVESADQQQILDSTISPTNSLESAVLGNLAPGAYTALVRGGNGSTGVGLVEVYDLGLATDSKLANISTRGFVDTGDNVMIGGTIIVGSTPTQVVVRAIGPSLTDFGISNALQDPTLELHDGNGALLVSNDNWIDSPDAAAISATTIPPTDNRESAILQNLPPGQYTAIVRGSGDSTGVALVEAYQLP